jgi:hypothetical protein
MRKGFSKQLENDVERLEKELEALTDLIVA